MSYMSESRTSKSVKNIAISLVSYFIGVCLTLISKKVFLDTLGADTLGLQSTIGGLLGTLSLAELGLGVAVGATLYKHIEYKEQDNISDIIAIQGWFYRWVALFITLGSCLLLIFSPSIFRKEELPLWFIYATFGVSLFNAILGYLYNYRSILLNADQKGYKLSGVNQIVTVIKVLLQVAILKIFDREIAYAFYLSIEVVVSIFGAYWLEYIMRKEYPWLKPRIKDGWQLRRKYPDLLKHTGQIFVHSISSVILTKISPLIMFAYSTLTIIGNYNTYEVLTNSTTLLIGSVLASIGAGIGTLVAEGNEKKILGFYWEQVATRQFIATIACAGFLLFGHDVIKAWVGAKYSLDNDILVLMVVYLYFNITRSVTDSYNSAYKLFYDVWAPLTEGGIILICALILGKYYGISGVLTSMIIGNILIVHIWKPIFLFKSGFKLPIREYWKHYIKYPLLSWILIGASIIGYSYFRLEAYSLPELLLHISLFASIFFVILFGVYWAASYGFRGSVVRIVSLIYKSKRS